MADKNDSKNELITTVLDEWKTDSKINGDEPGAELLKISTLHSKYLTKLSENRQEKSKLLRNLNKLKKIKFEYYSGKMDIEKLKKYGWEPFPYILKSELNTYLEADNHIQEIETQISVHEEIIDICTFILKEISSRTWQLKEFIGWTKFTSGC